MICSKERHAHVKQLIDCPLLASALFQQTGLLAIINGDPRSRSELESKLSGGRKDQHKMVKKWRIGPPAPPLLRVADGEILQWRVVDKFWVGAGEAGHQCL